MRTVYPDHLDYAGRITDIDSEKGLQSLHSENATNRMPRGTCTHVGPRVGQRRTLDEDGSWLVALARGSLRVPPGGGDSIADKPASQAREFTVATSSFGG